MKSRKPTIRRGLLLAMSAAAVVTSLSQTAAFAADTTAKAGEELTEVIVTGSRIRRTDSETPSPVQVITREDIERTGQQSISEIIRSVSADNQGSLPTAFTAGFAAGAAGVSLRGLGLNSTLVLVNGRRMATYGLADDGARSFVDLNSIPLEAVERVDVVKDGASAIYGSDAVAGVINIIMRENYQGASLGATGGSSYRGDGSQFRFTGSFGRGDIAADRYNLFVTAETSRDDAIAQSTRRSFLGTEDLRAFGFFDNRRGALAAGRGVFGGVPPIDSVMNYSTSTPYGGVTNPLFPSGTRNRIQLLPCPEKNIYGNCIFSVMDYNQIQPDSKRTNVFARGAVQFTDNAQGYLELGWFNSKIDSIGTPGGVNDGGVFNPSDPLNPVTAAHNPMLPANHPDNPTGVARSLRLLTTMLGGRDQVTDSKVTRIIGGVKGDVGAWRYDIGGGVIESKLKNLNTGFVYFPALVAALNNGTFRINPALNSAATLAAISPDLLTNATNKVSLIDATVSRDIWDLPGGKLGIAVGAEYRKETSDSPPVPFTDTSDIVGLGYAAFKADRNITAEYLEINAPVSKILELNAAYRFDKYSDYGNSSTPKLGFKLTPIPQISLRGTYSESFRAPGPSESGTSSSLGFTNIAIITLGDPSVKPETSKSFTFGIVAEPLEGSSVSIDYYNIKRKDEIVTADQATIVAGLPTTGVPNSVLPGRLPRSFLYYDDVAAQSSRPISCGHTRLASSAFNPTVPHLSTLELMVPMC
jgi:iron complex outermembrane recepter protein